MLTVYHLYPDILNLHGERGNIIAFRRRCEWRGIGVQVVEVHPGDPVDFCGADFVLLGGGADREQAPVARDLYARRGNIREAIEDGLVILATGGGYQMLGRYHRPSGRGAVPGLGLLDFHTRAGTPRLIGNAVMETPLAGRMVKVTGFENHLGRTFLGDIRPFGKVLAGHGNNGADGTEGARYRNVFCSYLHGPLLPANPALTDLFISLALKRKGEEGILEPLDDSFEDAARRAMLGRLKV